jgi:N-acyl-D-amino-acid deacylase
LGIVAPEEYAVDLVAKSAGGRIGLTSFNMSERDIELIMRQTWTMTCSEAMTSLPAQVFALNDRGQIRPGAFADILVFDPATVNDAATYDEPDRLAEGMTHIVINGVLVREAGTFSNALAGRVLRPERR